MSSQTAAQFLPFAVVSVLLALTCWHDIATRTLPDGIALGVAAIGLAWQAISGDLFWSVIVASAVFAGAALGWYLRALGGGDVKLLGACALLPSPSAVPQLLVVMALAGGVLSLIYLVARRIAPHLPGPAPSLPARIWRAEVWRMRRGGPLPYALPICLGTLFAMLEKV